MIPSVVIVHLTHVFFTATPWRTADVSLASQVSRLHKTSCDTHFHWTSFLGFTRILLCSPICRGPTTSFLPQCSNLIRFSLSSEVAVASTMLSNGTVIDGINPYAVISSFPTPSIASSGSLVRHISRNLTSVCSFSSNNFRLLANKFERMILQKICYLRRNLERLHCFVKEETTEKNIKSLCGFNDIPKLHGAAAMKFHHPLHHFFVKFSPVVWNHVWESGSWQSIYTSWTKLNFIFSAEPNLFLTLFSYILNLYCAAVFLLYNCRPSLKLYKSIVFYEPSCILSGSLFEPAMLLMFYLSIFKPRIFFSEGTNCDAVHRSPRFVARGRIFANSISKLEALSNILSPSSSMRIGVFRARLRELFYWQTVSLGPLVSPDDCLSYSYFTVSSQYPPTVIPPFSRVAWFNSHCLLLTCFFSYIVSTLMVFWMCHLGTITSAVRKFPTVANFLFCVNFVYIPV